MNTLPAHAAPTGLVLPTAPVVAASLVAGYAVARWTRRRPLGGVVLLAGGVLAGREWIRRGPALTAALSAAYVGAFVASHPLARRIGAWPSVFTVAAAAGAVAHVAYDRKA